MLREAALATWLCGIACPLYAQSQQCTSPTGRTVTVNGAATLRLVPDRVSFSVGVETESSSVAQAFRQNTEKVNSVIAVLKQRGIRAQDIQTSNFSITSRDAEGKKLANYRVTNLVSVTTDKLSSVGELLQSAVEKGANQAGSLNFDVARMKDAQLRGMELAFQDARTKAEKFAALSGKTLGDVVCISEEQYGGAYGNTLNVTVASPMAEPSIEAGSHQASFRIEAIFELK